MENTLKDFLWRCAKQENGCCWWNRSRATNLSYCTTSSSFSLSLLSSFPNNILGRGKNSTEQPACLLSSPPSWECTPLFNKPRTRLLAQKQRRWCIIHFGAVAPPRWGTKHVWCTTWAITEHLPTQLRVKQVQRQTNRVSPAVFTARGGETFFCRQLHDSNANTDTVD